MSNPAAARSSTFNPYRTQRLHGPHVREEAVFQKCPLPPERALSGLSWEFAGSDRGSPPGMGSTLGTGISPRGPPTVTRGEGPKVLDCCTTDSFWEPFWYPFLGPTRTQFYKKYQNGVPQSCQKGGRLLAQQSPNNPPQQSPPKPILNRLWPPGDCAIVHCKES